MRCGASQRNWWTIPRHRVEVHSEKYEEEEAIVIHCPARNPSFALDWSFGCAHLRAGVLRLRAAHAEVIRIVGAYFKVFRCCLS
jgi:hypothetical protein